MRWPRHRSYRSCYPLINSRQFTDDVRILLQESDPKAVSVMHGLPHELRLFQICVVQDVARVKGKLLESERYISALELNG